MKELILQLMTFSTFFVLIASSQAPETAQHLILKNGLTLELGEGSSDNEWIIETDPNHIFYFSFLFNKDVDEQQISSSLTITDADKPDSLLFPSEMKTLSPFYSTDNVVSIKFKGSPTLNPFQLKAEKAVSCPFNIGGSTSCGRVVDELSCYCGLFVANTWENTKAYCKSYNMSFLSIESYEEDLAVFTAFGGREILWIGASDAASEGTFIWDSTGKKLSPGYQGWAPDHPLYNSCGGNTSDCAAYNIASALPAWEDLSCTGAYGGICELQPTNSSRSINLLKLDLKEELIFDLSGSSDEWVISTDPNHIFYFSFITPADYRFNEQQIKQQIQSSLTIMDVTKEDSLLFPSNFHQLSPFYSTGNAVSIKFSKPSITISLNGFQLKAQRAVPCPFNLGGSSSCGRVVDDLSCYCALFASITWIDMKDFCKANNMSFVSIESYEEDLALYSAFGGSEVLWIGLSDTASEGNFIWDATGKPMSPGYQGWYPGRPLSSCQQYSSYDCVAYRNAGTSCTLPQWLDVPCTTPYDGGICELQPSNSSTF